MPILYAQDAPRRRPIVEDRRWFRCSPVPLMAALERVRAHPLRELAGLV